MEILIKGHQLRERKSIPFMRMLERKNRGLGDVAKIEWVNDADRRLRDVLSNVDPRPMIRGYSVERSDDGLTIITVTANKVGKREIGLLSAGDWPCWHEIIRAVPEFDLTQVVFDAVSRYEWLRRWDMQEQKRRIDDEYGLYS
jgi:hypothetical protein